MNEDNMIERELDFESFRNLPSGYYWFKYNKDAIWQVVHLIDTDSVIYATHDNYYEYLLENQTYIFGSKIESPN